MNTDPRGPETLLRAAGAAAETAISPYTWQNSLGQLVGSLRTAGQPTLALEVAGIGATSGDKLLNSISGLLSAVYTGSWPASLFPTDRYTVASYSARGYGLPPGQSFAMACKLEPTLTTLNAGESTVTGKGPDGLIGTGDDFKTVTFVGGPIQPYKHYVKSGRIIWRVKIGTPVLSWLQAAKLNVEALLDCQAIAGNPAAVASVNATLAVANDMLGQLDSLRPAIEAAAPFTVPVPQTFAYDSLPYYAGGTYVIEPIH